MMIKKLALVVFLLVLIAVISNTSWAKAPIIKPITVENVEVWADKEFISAFDAGKFSAAAIAVVQDGEVIFSRGYGFADMAKKTPMDPAYTRARVCSTSKLYVATSLMQLVDKGIIKSLDDPVNDYIKRVKLPNYNGRAITFRDLTTHRGGFEDQYFNAGTRVKVPTPSSAKTVRRLIPKQVREPGTLSVYSNANTALQGVVIEDLTGMTMKEYLTENIFIPLGMSRTVFNDNPPVPEGTAQPYIRFKDGRHEAMPIVAKHPVYAPSGGVYSTAEDMAQFIIAHLDAGHTAKPALLTPASFQTMHTEASRNHPALGAIGVQFFLNEINGVRIIEHGCGLPGFTSFVMMLPDQNTGVFVSVTSTSDRQTGVEKLKHIITAPPASEKAISPNRATTFYWRFLKEFVGFPHAPAIDNANDNLDVYTGHYKVERRAYTTLLAASELLSPNAFMMKVEKHPDGGLSINGSKPYRQIAPDVFQRGDHPARLFAFETGANAKATRLLRSTAHAWTRVPARKSSHALKNFFLIGLGLTLSGLLVKLWPNMRTPRATKWALRASLVIIISFTLLWIVATMNFLPAKNIEHYVNEGGTARLWIAAILCNFIALGGLALMISSIISWRNKNVPTGVVTFAWRAHLLVLAIGGILLIYALANVNLISFHLP